MLQVRFTPVRSGQFRFDINTRAVGGQPGVALSGIMGNVPFDVNSGPVVANLVSESRQWP